MAREVRLLQLGQTMEEGTIISCMVNVGDEVKKSDIIFEIETDKATLEMESPADGFVKHILAEVGQTLPVDHKVANGVYASQFLDLVRKLLEDTSTFE